MNIGLLTSWRTQCGIAEHSSHLARAMQRAGSKVLIFGSHNEAARNLPADPANAGLPVVEMFDVQLWRSDQRHEFDHKVVLASGLDVLHVQYEVVLFNRERLQELLDRFRGVTAITYHDSCIPPDMPGPFDLQFRHRADTGPGGEVIPFGVENHRPLVRTFGLGRTRADIIGAICDRHGWRFESAAGGPWMSQLELHAWLRAADAIVLWYDDVPAAGSSQAARTALATRRPVFVNDTTWFRDLPARTGNLHKLPDDPACLDRELARLLSAPYIEECSWDRVARLHIDAYQRVLDARLSEAA